MCLLQMRYAAGSKDVLDRFFNNKPLKKDDVIVEVCHLPCLPPWLCSCLFRVVWIVLECQICVILASALFLVGMQFELCCCLSCLGLSSANCSEIVMLPCFWYSQGQFQHHS